MLKVAAPFFQNEGVSAEILSMGCTPGPYAEHLHSAGYVIRHLPFEKSPRFFSRFFSLLCREHYDVVHIHTESARFYLSFLALISNCPQVVTTIHSVFAFQGLLRWRRSLQRQWLQKLGVSLVSIGKSVKINERKCFGIDTILINNWYDSESFFPPSLEGRKNARKAFDIPDEALAVVSVGNCSPVKNHPALLEALSILRDQVDFIYLHAGGEEPNQPERQIASRFGIMEKTRFLGFVDSVPGLLHAADVFVMPSIHEGCSIAALEAMGAGVPVILSDVPGLADLKTVSSDIIWSGLCPSDLAKALCGVAALSTEERGTLGNRIHDTVKNLYGIEQGSSEYLNLYRRHRKRPSIFSQVAHNILIIRNDKVK